MTKVYELPNGHRMVADIDESTRVCNITETTLDSLVSKLNYYAEQTDVLDKIRVEIKAMFPPSGSWMYEEGHEVEHTVCEVLSDVLKIIDKYKAESEDKVRDKE